MLLAGEIGKPHGLAGEVYVVVISDDPQRFAPGSQLLHGDGRTLVVATSRAHGDRFLVRFEGIETREEAMRLRGSLFIEAAQARSLEPDEFWHEDLIGCSVTVDDAAVGTVTGVISGPVQDLLQVDTERGERLVPLVKQIVTTVDIAARTIVIDPPEGLLD